MSNEIVPYAAESLGDRMEYARTLTLAGDLIPRGLWAPVRKPDGTMAPPEPNMGKVLLVLETGAMLGLHPVAALQGVNVIEGKATTSAALMSAVVRGAGHKLSLIESGTIEGGDYSVTGTLTRSDDPEHPFVSTWTPQRAARAGLCSYSKGADDVWKVTARSQAGKALPWESYTESLCKARVVSELGRDGAQDALMGIRYTPEELGAEVDAQGDVVTIPEARVEQAKPEPTAAPPARKRATRGAQGTKRQDTTSLTDDAPTSEATEPVEAVEATIEPDAPAAPAEPSSEPSVPAAGEEIAEPVIEPEPGTEQPLTAEEQAEADEALRRKVEAAQAEARAAAEEPPLEETPSGEVKTADDYRADADKAASANDLTALRAVWDAAVAASPPMLSAALQQHILKLKGEVELRLSKADADSAAAAATEGKPSTRAAVLGD